MDFREAINQLRTHLGGVIFGLDESVSKSLTGLVRMSDLKPATAHIVVWDDGTFQVTLRHVDSEGAWEKVGKGPSVMTAAAMCIGQEWECWSIDAEDVEQIDG